MVVKHKTSRLILVFSLLIILCASASQVTNVSGQPSTPPTIDGVIDANEYEYMQALDGSDYILYWTLTPDNLSIGIVANTQGFVGIGFDPVQRMLNADIIIAWVTPGDVLEIFDTYATGETGPHPEDTDQGGTYDLTEAAGTANSTHTIIEFRRPRIATDPYDNTIPYNSSFPLIWAYSSQDSFTATHLRRGTITLNLNDPGPGPTTGPPPTLWPVHAGLMSTGLVFMILGLGVARWQRKRPRWMHRHHLLVVPGVALILAALTVAVYMVQITSGIHFKVPHAYLGLLGLGLAVVTPVLIYYGLRTKQYLKTIYPTHRWIARITIIVILLTIISGLILVTGLFPLP